MSITTSFLLAMASASVILVAPAQAQTIEVGHGILCDTRQQVERLVALYDDDEDAAMSAVNAEENDPTACVSGTVAFVRGPDVTTASGRSGTFRILRVLVVGIVTEAGVRRTAPAAYFSVERVDEKIA